MAHVAISILLGVAASPTVDPAGDVFLFGDPSQPAPGTTPDLISSNVAFDRNNNEIRFEFTFDVPVFPADDFDHLEGQLHGFVDIDLDVPPVSPNTSKKSELSGFQSGLGIEAYIDLSSASGGFVNLLDANGTLLSTVVISFVDETTVTIRVPFADLYDPDVPANVAIAYAAYFVDFFQATSDVFPNDARFATASETPPTPQLLEQSPSPDAVVNRVAGVTRIVVRYDLPVTLAEFQVAGVNTGEVTSGVLMGNGTEIIVLEFADPLPDQDRYTATVNKGSETVQWTFATLVGDCNGDEVVNIFDLGQLRAALRAATFDTDCDVWEDGVNDIFDLLFVRDALRRGSFLE